MASRIARLPCQVYRVHHHRDATGELVRSLCEPYMTLNEVSLTQGGVAFSREHMRLAIAGENTLSVVDLDTGTNVRSYSRSSRVRCVAISRRGDAIVSGGFDRCVCLHNVSRGARLQHFRGGEGIVRSVHLSEDSSLLVIGGENHRGGLVRLFDVATGERLAQWHTQKPIWSAKISPDGRYIAAAGYDETLFIFDAMSHEALQQVRYAAAGGAPAFIWTICFSDDSSHLAVACWNKEAYVYSICEPPDISAMSSTSSLGSRASPRRGSSSPRRGSGRRGSSCSSSIANRRMSSELSRGDEMLLRPTLNALSRRSTCPSSMLSLVSAGSCASVPEESLNRDSGQSALAEVSLTDAGRPPPPPPSPWRATSPPELMMSPPPSPPAASPATPPAAPRTASCTSKTTASTPPSASPADSATRIGGSASSSAVLTEVASVKLTDRCYSVALDSTGSHMAVGGRDKRVALYLTQTKQLLWEVSAEDFVCNRCRMWNPGRAGGGGASVCSKSLAKDSWKSEFATPMLEPAALKPVRGPCLCPLRFHPALPSRC